MKCPNCYNIINAVYVESTRIHKVSVLGNNIQNDWEEIEDDGVDTGVFCVSCNENISALFEEYKALQPVMTVIGMNQFDWRNSLPYKTGYITEEELNDLNEKLKNKFNDVFWNCYAEAVEEIAIENLFEVDNEEISKDGNNNILNNSNTNSINSIPDF